MRSELCDLFGIDVPIFAFTHCRDVVVEVSKAGGFGVLGAVGFTPRQLEIELQWIDERIGDRPYGVDTIIPNKYEGEGETDAAKLETALRAAVPQAHYDFSDRVLAEHGVPEFPEEEKGRELLGWTHATALPQVEIALAHEKVQLIANALGTPPPDVIQSVHACGRKVAALCGNAHHALRHKEAGVDIIIAQGHEGGGHTGEIASMVLWPEVVDAVAPTPVLAAGGVGSGRQIAAAMALGAAGTWSGTRWLTVKEAAGALAQKESYLAATSRDTVRTRSISGKPARILRNDWTEAWDRPDAPDPLPMPLQGLVSIDMMRRTMRYPDQAQAVAFNPAGQVIGMLNQVQSVRAVMSDLIDDFHEAVERLQESAAQPG
ncbi:MAG: nitronate monooxygenase family protein [Myxococcota bacterium]|jgi:NAD(P)H-dependent flavin oxidoreductase YrpB (nitropropane dioxygenase family)|nr:nitronate monooxygenase family protein [Myxococcota bacterium]